MNCKKCGKPLPTGHKGKLCEHCSGKKAHVIRKTVKNVIVPTLGLCLLVVTKGHINLGQK